MPRPQPHDREPTRPAAPFTFRWGLSTLPQKFGARNRLARPTREVPRPVATQAKLAHWKGPMMWTSEALLNVSVKE